MKITVLGCGAMGSIYAALLATAGHEVTAVDANSDHVAAINANGLHVSGASGDRTVNIKAQTEMPLTPAELLIIAVKGAHVASASEKAFSTIDSNSLVLTIQNGGLETWKTLPVLPSCKDSFWKPQRICPPIISV